MVNSPTATVQSGCCKKNVGVAGVGGCIPNVMNVGVEIQPEPFLAVTLCVEPEGKFA